MNSKGKGKRAASTQVSIRFFTKASFHRTSAPSTSFVGSPLATLAALALDHVAAPSHSGVIIPPYLARGKSSHQIHPPFL